MGGLSNVNVAQRVASQTWISNKINSTCAVNRFAEKGLPLDIQKSGAIRKRCVSFAMNAQPGMTEAAAAQMKRVVLIPPSRGMSPLKVVTVTAFVGKMNAQELKERYGYPLKMTHGEYWVWRVAPRVSVGDS